MRDDAFDGWFAALEARHLGVLTRSEVTRALRALSSCYVERREKLAAGAALDGAGKRAAFALFYGALHLLTISEIVRALDGLAAPASIVDLGCGTGVGGAAWALAGRPDARIAGVDRHPWAVTEATWTYRHFGLRGSAKRGDAVTAFPRTGSAAIVLAYTANELADEKRTTLLECVFGAAVRGCPVLVVEPIARKDRAWWPAWVSRLAPAGVVEREWRLPARLPAPLRQLAHGAGLDPRELTARTLSR